MTTIALLLPLVLANKKGQRETDLFCCECKRSAGYSAGSFSSVITMLATGLNLMASAR